jgi:hypothetical protein
LIRFLKPALVLYVTVFVLAPFYASGAVGSLGLTAWAFWTNKNMMAAPVAPFGMGQAIPYPFYFAATFQRLRRHWAET